MKSYKLYTYTALIFIALFGILSFLTIPLIVKQYTIQFLESTYKNIEKEGNTLEVIYQSIKKGEDFSSIAQSTIQNTQNNNAFLSVIDWSGSYVCNPDITLIGESVAKGKTPDSEGEITGEKLYNQFFDYFNTLKKNTDVEMLALKPIKGSDFIMVFNLNVKEISRVITQIKGSVYIVFVILGLFLFLVLLILIRLVSLNSSKMLEQKVMNLEYNAQSLAKLNDSITSYQERLQQQEEKRDKAENHVETTIAESQDQQSETSKQRILTYVRNELVSILITDIAYIFVDSTITYIVRKNGKMATSNDSLDKIYSVLDKELFFKTNRQFVVAITAIEKITKFENSKLKIQVKPKSDIDIIIGKNKASAFKQWLDL